MFNLAIEGNIGAGKSTFLEYLSKKFPGRINIYTEPVHKWRNVSNVNLFDLMYKDPKRYGFIFQSYVQLTMLQMHSEISEIQVEQAKKFINQQKLLNSLSKEEKSKEEEQCDSQPINVTKDRTVILKDLTNQDNQNSVAVEMNDKKRKTSPSDEYTANLKKKVMKTNNQTNESSDCKLGVLSDFILNNTNDQFIQPTYSINMMERSIFSARYIFVENLFQNNLLTDIEYSILDDTFLFLVKKQNIKLDLIIYLRSKPEECYERMMKRSRPEETQTLQLEHFKKFHQLHEDFLIGENSRMKQVLNVPVLVIDTLDSKEKMYEKIDHHSKLIMNDLIKSENLTEVACQSY